MIYNHKCLNNDESLKVVALLEHYRGYDFLDLIIELAVANPYDILKRTQKNKKIQTIVSEPMPAEIMYCTTDSCELPVTLTKEKEKKSYTNQTY